MHADFALRQITLVVSAILLNWGIPQTAYALDCVLQQFPAYFKCDLTQCNLLFSVTVESRYCSEEPSGLLREEEGLREIGAVLLNSGKFKPNNIYKVDLASYCLSLSQRPSSVQRNHIQQCIKFATIRESSEKEAEENRVHLQQTIQKNLISTARYKILLFFGLELFFLLLRYSANQRPLPFAIGLAIMPILSRCNSPIGDEILSFSPLEALWPLYALRIATGLQKTTSRRTKLASSLALLGSIFVVAYSIYPDILAWYSL
jgi:hypothetical protein